MKGVASRFSGYFLVGLLGCTVVDGGVRGDGNLERILSLNEAKLEREKYEKENSDIRLPDWVYSLKDDGVIILKIPQLDSNGDTIPCGPRALAYVFRSFGDKVDIDKMNEMRKGGFVRWLSSAVDEKGNEITWPSEIVGIGKFYGYEVKTVQDREATLDRMIAEYSKGNKVIVRVAEDWPFDQHYAVFDPYKMKVKQRVVLDDEKEIAGREVIELYVFSKKGSARN